MNEAFKFENPPPSPEPERLSMTSVERAAGGRLEAQGVIRHIVNRKETPFVREILDGSWIGKKVERDLKKARTRLTNEGERRPVPIVADGLLRTLAAEAETIQRLVPKDSLGKELSDAIHPFIAQDVSLWGEGGPYKDVRTRLSGIAWILHRGKEATKSSPQWKEAHHQLVEAHAALVVAYRQYDFLQSELYVPEQILRELREEYAMLVRQKDVLHSLRTAIESIPKRESLSSTRYAQMLYDVEPPLPDMIYKHVAMKVGGRRERDISESDRAKLLKKFDWIIDGYEDMITAYDRSIAETEAAILKR